MMAAPGPYYGTHSQPMFQAPPPPAQFVYNPYDQPLTGQPHQYHPAPPQPHQYYGQQPPPPPPPPPPDQQQYYPVPSSGYQAGQQPQNQQQSKTGCCQSVMQSLMCCCAGMLCFMCLCQMCEGMGESGLCMDGGGGAMDSYVTDD